MSEAHNDPAYAAVRAFSDLPVLSGDPPLPPPETFRERLLARDVGTMRDRQRADLQRTLDGWLARMATDGFEWACCINGWIFGAVMGAHAMDVISYAEAEMWQRRAMDALREAK